MGIFCCRSNKREQLCKDEKYAYDILTPEGLDDFHDHGPDVEAICDESWLKLNRYEKFEHHFPFYRMDVNGFCFLIRTATLSEHSDIEESKFL